MDEPTPIFVYPTPTLPYDPDSDATPVLYTLEGVGTDSAEAIVQGYAIANSHGHIDYFWMFVILAAVLFSIWTLNRRIQRA